VVPAQAQGVASERQIRVDSLNAAQLTFDGSTCATPTR